MMNALSFKHLVSLLLFTLLFFQLHAEDSCDDSDYQIGAAIRSITGPSAEVGFMGYAELSQTGRGIHIRQFARAFVLKHKCSQKKIAYVNLDMCFCTQAAKETIIQRLKDMGIQGLSRENVIIGSTHTHSGPGGFSWYNLYDITTLGFEKENFETIISGVVNAIAEAETKLSQGGRLFVNSGRLLESNINRSPTAYLENPEQERKEYENDGDTEKTMTILKMQDENGNNLGLISWFSVHCTSMNHTNRLISSDNKGYASYLFERYMNPEALPGHNAFVAAFPNTNEGDVSPNTRGPSCPDGSPCDILHSTCNGSALTCIAKGPGRDMFESTKIIGTNQFKKALELFDSAKTVVSGPIEFRHTHLNMSNIQVQPDYTPTKKSEKTCRGAMGFSFAAGTTDGPSDFPWFEQGDNSTGNPFWRFISSFLAKPTPEQIECQKPKPILIDVGLFHPSPWTPEILPIQVFTIGKQLTVCSVPAEFTTMAGRRLKKRVKDTLVAGQKVTSDSAIVVSGLTNAYSGYVTTYEEYQQQRYEGASTVFGPHTLAAYIQEMDKLAKTIVNDKPAPEGPNPANLSGSTWSFRPGVIADTHPFGEPFGSVRTDAKSSYHTGEQVRVEFWSAHPNNDFHTQRTFLTVELYTGSDPETAHSDKWQPILSDADWDTKFEWRRHLIAESIATITWDISRETKSGTYRIRHFGVSKNIFGTKTPFEGTSRVFKVVSNA